jgi:hypothetical protein
MITFNQLDSAALNVVKEALDAFQRFEHWHPDSAAYFRLIITRLLGRVEEFDIWTIRTLINQAQRSRRSVYATVKGMKLLVLRCVASLV